MSGGFRFHPSGDVEFVDEHRGEQFWIMLPRIGQMRRIDEFAAELGKRRAPLEEKVAAFRGTYNQWNALVEKAKTDDGLTDEERERLAELSKRIEAEASDHAEVLAEFNQRIREDSLAWLVRVVEVVGAGWPESTDDWPMATQDATLVRRIKEHWRSVPLA